MGFAVVLLTNVSVVPEGEFWNNFNELDTKQYRKSSKLEVKENV